MSVGERIKARRKELNLSVDEVADKLGKNRATIYRYESDEIENLPVTVLEPLAKILNTTPSYLMGWDKIEEDYNFSTHLSSTYYNSLMKWSEDKLLNKYETTIIRGHMADLFIRYKKLIEGFVYAQMNWRNTKDDFIKLYKQRQEPLTDVEIKELFLKQELERQIEDMAIWVRNFPGWVARSEEEYLKQSEDTPYNQSYKTYTEDSKADSYLLPNAANKIEGASDEDKAHDDALMDDDDF